MKNLAWKRIVVCSCICIAFAMGVSGCASFDRAHKFEPIVIKNAAVGLNFTADGKVVFIDQNGEKIKPQSLKDQIDRKYKQGSNWNIEKVQDIEVFHVTGSHEIWIHIDNECICLLYSDSWQYLGPCH